MLSRLSLGREYHPPPFSKGRLSLGVRRGALTFTRFFVLGKPPKDLRKRYLEAVRLRKFEPLSPEDEASEAVGWCVIERPFDLDFEPEKIFEDSFVLLGLRVDKWKIPGPILRSHVADEEQRALSKGAGRQKLTKAEREDIKLRVIGRLRRKILPTSRSFDVFWSLDAGTVLLFTHSARTALEFTALFEKSFGLTLVPDSPYGAAERAGLPAALWKAFERVEPLSFVAGRKALGLPALPVAKPSEEDEEEAEADEPEEKPSKRRAAAEEPEEVELSKAEQERADLIERIETTRFLGSELLLWLWVRSELFSQPLLLGELGDAEIWVDRKLNLEHILDKSEKVAVRGAQPAGSTEAREAVRNMKMPVGSRLVLRVDNQDFAFDLNAPRFLIGAGSIPAVLSEDGDDAFLERAALIARLNGYLDAIFAAFLRERLPALWTEAWQPGIVAWAEGEKIPNSVLKALAAASARRKKS